MKEMTTEQKARAYDEALERAKKVHKYSSDLAEIKRMEEIFPELNWGEDEIKKDIVAAVETYGDFTQCRKEEIYAWLKRQGENKSIIEMKSPEESLEISSKEYNEIVNDCLYSELKTNNNVKAKFNIGDWVIWDNKVICYIDNIYQGKESLMYTITDTNNMTCSYSVKDFDNNAHSWIVQDAKDGDVLAVNWQEGDDSWEKIIIFKKYHEKGVEGLTNTPCVEGYGNTFKNGKLAFHEEVPYFSQTWTVILHPATKEQRDLLFQKTKEAGYEWDVEKKELKKIEQKPNFCHHEVDLSNCSEEYCKAYYDGWNNCNQQHAQLEAEQKHTWSEEDEKMCQNLLECLRNGWKKLPADVSKCESWLKSLKEKYSWKPTDEQIKALDYVINLMASSESPTENDYYYNVFKDMRTHLKKLKEE